MAYIAEGASPPGIRTDAGHHPRPRPEAGRFRGSTAERSPQHLQLLPSADVGETPQR
jgi:hypothetical protein